MLIAAHMAGLSWSDADKLRKAIGKKDAVLMASMRQKFLDGCVRRGVSRGIAEELWDQVQYFGGYGFNKAHAAGYATLTYQTAYLKAHYPVEYFASLLSVKGDNADDRREYISEARAVGIEILQPDVNLSTNRCIIMNEAIYLPLTMVDQVGSKACEAILEERAKGKFRSYQDFCDRVPKRTVGKRVKENLIRAGAFDNLHPRDDLMGSVFGDTLTHDGVSLICEIIELPLQSEFEIDGIVGKVYEHIDKRDGLMAFVTIEDNTDRLEVIIFADQYYYPIEPGNRIQLSARLEQHDPLKAMALDYEILEV